MSYRRKKRNTLTFQTLENFIIPKSSESIFEVNSQSNGIPVQNNNEINGNDEIRDIVDRENTDNIVINNEESTSNDHLPPQRRIVKVPRLTKRNIYSKIEYVDEDKSDVWVLNLKTRGSCAWKCFWINSSRTKVKCIYCDEAPRLWCKSAPTTPLLDHFQKYHGDILTDVDENKLTFRENLVNFICSSSLPVSTVNNPYFKTITKEKLPCDKTLRKWIIDEYESKKENVIISI